MGKATDSGAEENYFGGRPQENRSRPTSEVGKGEKGRIMTETE
jgi:hypothetical protein